MGCRICYSENVAPDPNTPSIIDHETFMNFELYSCADCKSAFVLHAPEGAELESHYHAQGGAKMRNEPSRIFSWARRRFMLREIRNIERLVGKKSPLKILEVGSGDGSLVALAQHLGHDVTASDLFPVKDWKRTKIDYIQFTPGVLLQDTFSELGSVDVVIMRHVLEHVPDPQGLMTSLAHMNVKYLVITVPNWSSPFRRLLRNNWYYLDPPRHLSHFSAYSLRVLGEQANWDLIRLSRVGIDELVTAAYRYCSIKFPNRVNGRMVDWIGPTSVPAGISSVFAKTFRTAALTAVFENNSRK